MATINFRIHSTKETSNIYIRIKDGSKIDFETKTNLVINSSDWSITKQKPKNVKTEALRKLDLDLQTLRTNLLNYYNNSDHDINLIWLKNFINPIDKKEIPKGLIQYFDFYLEERKTELNHRTIQKIKVVQNKLIKLQKETRKAYLIKDINTNFKNEFFKWNEKKGYSENTILNNLKEIKGVCFHARKKGLTLSNEISEIKVVQKKAISVYLTFEEIDKIIQKELKIEILKDARDWLVISCFTGQRVSDFLRFTKEMIREQGGTKLIEFTQKKTGKIMTLPLHPKVIEILNKRDGEFPAKMTEPIYNKEIKSVCKKVGFKEMVFGGKIDTETNRKVMKLYPKHELITSHIGRRSFATNHYGKIPTPLLMGATGHATETMFLVYIGKSDAEKALQLSEWF